MPTRSKWRNRNLEYYDLSNRNILWRGQRNHWHADFLETTSIPGDGSRANGTPWVQDITGAAPPTVTLGADAQGANCTSTLTSDSQAQDATIHFDDNRHFDVTNNLIFQARAQVSVLPTLVAECSLGLMGDHAAGILNTTYNVGFIIDVAGAVSCVLDDNAAQQTASSGVTMTVSTWYDFLIDCTNVNDIRFFINGANVATGTTFSYDATGANAILQPVFGCYKASGAGVGTGILQSMDIWQD